MLAHNVRAHENGMNAQHKEPRGRIWRCQPLFDVRRSTKWRKPVLRAAKTPYMMSSTNWQSILDAWLQANIRV